MFNKGKKIVLAALVALSALLTPQLAAASSPGKHSKTLEKASALIDSGKYKEAEALLAGVPGKEFPEVYYYLPGSMISAKLKSICGKVQNSTNSTAPSNLPVFTACLKKKQKMAPKDLPFLKRLRKAPDILKHIFRWGECSSSAMASQKISSWL